MNRRRIAIACLLASVAACTYRPEAGGSAQSPSPSASATIGPADDQPSITPLPPVLRKTPRTPPPKQIVAVTLKDGIVVSDAATGATIRTLVSAKDAGDAAGGLEIDRKRGHLYFTTEESEDCFVIMRVPLKGGKAVKIVDGYGASVSPDGSKLAWARQIGCGATDDRFFIRVLASGTTRSVANTAEGGSFGHVEWASDSRSLFVDQCGVDQCRPFYHPVDRTTVTHSREFFIPSSFDDADLSVASWLRRGKNLVFIVDYSNAAQDARRPMVEINPRGQFVTTLFENGDAYRPFDFDNSGEHLLVEYDKTLHRWSTGTLTKIGTRFTSAVWY